MPSISQLSQYEYQIAGISFPRWLFGQSLKAGSLPQCPIPSWISLSLLTSPMSCVQQSESFGGIFREIAVKCTLYSGELPQSNRFVIGLTLGHHIGCKGIVPKSSISSPRNQKSEIRVQQKIFYHKSIAVNLFLYSPIKSLILVKISYISIDQSMQKQHALFC